EKGFSLDDGTNTYDNISDSAELYPGTGSFTVDAWINSSQTEGIQTIIIHYECANHCPSSAASVYDLYLDNGLLSGEIRDTNGTDQLFSGSSNIADGNFHHVALERDVDANEMRLSLDGAVEASQTLTATAAPHDHDH